MSTSALIQATAEEESQYQQIWQICCDDLNDGRVSSEYPIQHKNFHRIIPQRMHGFAKIQLKMGQETRDRRRRREQHIYYDVKGIHPEIKKLQDWESFCSRSTEVGRKKVSWIPLWSVSWFEAGEQGYRLDQRMIECQTRHGKGCKILRGFEGRVNSVLNGREVDLGTIVLVTPQNSSCCKPGGGWF
ncbi:hypothetical protein EV421DRAFT_1741500 [Armillaria borealis]|uniref:Uncharacterized protein n=1 Tax=Armillaria borealis TaxID=47425 RepID=A0AA39J0Z9_9AGAR|nr:hypothetical protein EV421DRAFT_1741500 [Armillaria borealis]